MTVRIFRHTSPAGDRLRAERYLGGVVDLEICDSIGCVGIELSEETMLAVVSWWLRMRENPCGIWAREKERASERTDLYLETKYSPVVVYPPSNHDAPSIVTKRYEGDTSTKGEKGWVVERDRCNIWGGDVLTVILDSNWQGPVAIGGIVEAVGNTSGRPLFRCTFPSE